MRVDFWCPKVFVQIVTYQIRFRQSRERPPFWLLWIDVVVVVEIDQGLPMIHSDLSCSKRLSLFNVQKSLSSVHVEQACKTDLLVDLPDVRLVEQGVDR